MTTKNSDDLVYYFPTINQIVVHECDAIKTEEIRGLEYKIITRKEAEKIERNGFPQQANPEKPYRKSFYGAKPKKVNGKKRPL